MNIIHNCVKQIEKDGITEIYLLGSEGTIDSGIYQDALGKEGIRCIVPVSEEYGLLRKCIEAVKQNNYTDEIKSIFLELIERQNSCILGCTELPILYEKYKQNIPERNIYDPVLLGLRKLKEEYDNV